MKSGEGGDYTHHRYSSDHTKHRRVKNKLFIVPLYVLVCAKKESVDRYSISSNNYNIALKSTVAVLGVISAPVSQMETGCRYKTTNCSTESKSTSSRRGTKRRQTFLHKRVQGIILNRLAFDLFDKVFRTFNRLVVCLNGDSSNRSIF